MFTPRTRLINPRLGTYFGIFTSAFVAIALLSLILEQLGVSSALLSLMMMTGPLVLYAAIGLATYTREPLDYFAAGRRVPAAYSGAGLAVTATGATGLLAFTGVFFHLGFDGLCLMIGVLAGFVVMAVLLAPFLRKFGAFTIPSYLGRRFDSRMVRVVAAALLAVPMLLVLAAEVRMGAFAAALLTGRSQGAMASHILLVVVVMLIAGGVRALTWSSVAAAIAVLIAFLAPVAIIAVLRGDLPLVQLGHGPLLKAIGRDEAVRALEIVRAAPLDFNLSGLEPMAIAKRYALPFGEVGSVSFVLTILMLMAGVSSAPWLLPRVASSPGVYEARKSLGWATVLFGIAMLTATAIAVYMRSEVMELTGSRTERLPVWLTELQSLGLAGGVPDVGRVAIGDLRFARDGIVLALPIAAGLPAALVQLAAAGVVAAAVAGAGAAAIALGDALSEDVFHGLSWETQAPGPRLVSARVFLAIAAALGGLVATVADGDPLKLMMWAFAITGASGFPVLVLSIWWKRLNAYGVAASLVSGFGLAVVGILAAEAGWLPISSLLAGIIGLPVAVVVALAVSVVTPAPSRHVPELVRETRIPGGEILYDREMRLQRLKRRSPA